MIQQTSKLISFQNIGEEPIGFISIADHQKSVPFEIKRVYWTYNTPSNITRGNHAHKSLSQVLIAINGILKVELESTKGKISTFCLSDPNTGLLVPPIHWRKITFSQSAVLLCLASEVYDEKDYIRDYSEFKNLHEV